MNKLPIRSKVNLLVFGQLVIEWAADFVRAVMHDHAYLPVLFPGEGSASQ